MADWLTDITLTKEELSVALVALDGWIGKELRVIHARRVTDDSKESPVRQHRLAVAEVLRQRLVDAQGRGGPA